MPLSQAALIVWSRCARCPAGVFDQPPQTM